MVANKGPTGRDRGKGGYTKNRWKTHQKDMAKTQPHEALPSSDA